MNNDAIETRELNEEEWRTTVIDAVNSFDEPIRITADRVRICIRDYETLANRCRTEGWNRHDLPFYENEIKLYRGFLKRAGIALP